MQLTRNQRSGIRLADWQAHYMRLYGVSPAGHKAWSTEEVEVLRRLYPNYSAIHLALPWRTASALRRKVERLGLAAPRRVWHEGQWSFARPLYRRGDGVREVIAPAVSKSPRQVWGKAAKAGVRRPRKPPKETPWPLVNAVRAEAFRQRLSMVDLDELAGTGHYFRRSRRLDYDAVKKAVALLGGRISIRWTDE